MSPVHYIIYPPATDNSRKYIVYTIGIARIYGRGVFVSQLTMLTNFFLPVLQLKLVLPAYLVPILLTDACCISDIFQLGALRLTVPPLATPMVYTNMHISSEKNKAKKRFTHNGITAHILSNIAQFECQIFFSVTGSEYTRTNLHKTQGITSLQCKRAV